MAGAVEVMGERALHNGVETTSHFRDNSDGRQEAVERERGLGVEQGRDFADRLGDGAGHEKKRRNQNTEDQAEETMVIHRKAFRLR